MPIDFKTQAANADDMGEDALTEGEAEGMTREIGGDGTPRDRSDLAPTGKGQAGADAVESKPGDAGAGEDRPGKDIHAAGFVKDKDAGRL